MAAGLESVEALNRELADRPPVPMGAEEGNEDGQDLLDGTLSPEAQIRLDAATTLTGEQQAALERGELVVPPGQLEYLQRMSRSLDGKSTEELQQLVEKLGPNGDRLVDAMRLASNPHVAGTGVEGRMPSRGGISALPSSLQSTLKDPTLRVEQSTFERLVASGDRGFDPRVLFTHWEGYQDMAAILSHGDRALMRGSELDTGLLKKSDEALRWMNTGVWSGDTKSFATEMTGDVQNMLSASGRDPVAAHDAVTWKDQAGNAVYNDEFLGNLLTHKWTDGSVAASALLGGVAPAAQMSDPGDLTQQAMAIRAGETVHAFDQYVGSHRDELLNIAGTDNLSLGELNPALTRSLADATVPYIDDMLDNKLDSTAGFAPLDNVIEDPGLAHTRNLFGVLGTDDAAATLNTKAYTDIDAYQDSFAKSMKSGDYEYFDLKSSGALRGVIDAGANVAANDDISDANKAAEQAYANRQLWYEAAQTLPGLGTAVDKVGEVPDADDVLKQLLIGDEPVAIDAKTVERINEDLIKHGVVNRLLQENAGDTSALAGFVDENGQLKPFSAPGVSTEELTNAMASYLSSLGVPMNAAWDDYGEYYENVIEGQGK